MPSTALRSAALAAILLVSPARAIRAQIATHEVASVVFTGNATFPKDSLARAIVTRETECRSGLMKVTLCPLGVAFAFDRQTLNEREIPRDQARLEIWYQRRGFREVRVDTATVILPDGRARVEFTIDEGEPVRASSIDFFGAQNLPSDGLLENLPLRTGARLSVLALDATRDTLIHRLRNRGYAHADVLRRFLIPAQDPYRAQVSFDIDPGPVARYGVVSITGNQELSDATVLRTLQFRTGDVYRVDQLADGQARLFGLEIIRTASVTPNLDAQPDSVVPVSVTVAETDAYRVRTGGGWTSAECVNLESTWTSRNFMGGGRTLQVRGRLGNVLAPGYGDLLCPQGGTAEKFDKLTWLGAVDFAQPWIFSTRNSFTASLFAERQAVPDIYIRTAKGLQLSLIRSIGPQTPLTLSYRPERSRLDAAEFLFCTAFLVCTPEDIAILAGDNWLAPVGLNFTRNFADNLLNPTKGYRLIVDLEHARSWTGSDFSYDRFAAEGTWYARIGGSPNVFAARVRGGWVGSGGFSDLIRPSGSFQIIHPQKRFYAGGANSVRGYGQSRLGPRVLSIEPRTLLDSIQGMPPACTPAQIMDLSCDASDVADAGFQPRPTGGTRVIEGNVEVRFGLGRSFEGVTFADFGQVWGASDDVSLNDIQVTPGVGVRFFTPIGPIRVDLGYRFRTGEDLSVITSQIRAATAAECPASGAPTGCIFAGGQAYLPASDLAVLAPMVRFGESSHWFSASHFQLHFSIGQAF